MLLREHQENAVRVITETFRFTNKQYIEMPTGSGKTITFLFYAKNNHKKVLIIVPSIQLLEQVYEESLKFYDNKKVSRKGGNHLDKPRGIHICVIHSIKGKYLEMLSATDFDLVIFDEAHHIQADSYRRFLKEYDQRNTCKNKVFYLGVTATPDRLDGKILNELLEKCSFKIEIQELIQKKYLSDIEGFSVKTGIDITKVDSHNGDFSLRHLYKTICNESRNSMIVKLVKDEMNDRKTIVFCVDIKHSKEVSRLLEDKNISSAHIDGAMSISQRSAILSAFREGQIKVLCNCQLLTEGFDEPSIDGIVLARPTRSRALFTQMIGRGLRIFPGKNNCKIIDVVDSHTSLAGFNSILEDTAYPSPSKFKSIKDIEDHINKERLKITEFRVERADLLKKNSYEHLEATNSMKKQLEERKIKFFEPISFDEASFLLWHDNLKKEYSKWR